MSYYESYIIVYGYYFMKRLGIKQLNNDNLYNFNIWGNTIAINKAKCPNEYEFQFKQTLMR